VNNQDALTAGEADLGPPAHCPHPPRGQLITKARLWYRARGLRLTTRLGILTVVDETERLRAAVEIVHQRLAGGGILPITVRIGHEVRDEDVLAEGGISSLCLRYNGTLARLHELAARRAELSRHARVSLASVPGLEDVHRELLQLDALIERRQAVYMPGRVVLLATLAREIEFFSHRADQAATAVAAAENIAAGVTR
jgi:hypothetical protein